MKFDPCHDYEAALRDPAACFASPQQVLTTPLSAAQKRELLLQWERDARALQVAEEEGMGGGEEAMLARVQEALKQLGISAAPTASTGTKHGA